MPAAVMAAMLAIFVVVEALAVEPLTDSRVLLGSGGAVAAVTGTGLLGADAFLPVPSRGVMLAQGALFGIVDGAALYLVGPLGAFVLAFAVGGRGAEAVERRVSEEERSRAGRLLHRWRCSPSW